MINEFTIIIPTYNRSAKTRRAIESVISQSRLPSEIIIVDDGSIPSFTFREISKVKITIIRHEKNLGPSAARNTGLKAADTDWVSFLDSDDWLLPDSLKWRMAVIDDTDSFKIYGCSWLVVDEKSGNVIRSEHPRNVETNLDHYTGIWFCPGSCVFFNSKMILNTTGGFNEALSRYEDYEWFCRLAEAGYELVVDQRVGVNIERNCFKDVKVARQNAEAILNIATSRNLESKKLKRVKAYLNYELTAANYYSNSYFTAIKHALLSIAFLPRISLNPLSRGRKFITVKTSINSVNYVAK